MILNTLAAAIMLLWVNFAPAVTVETTVEPLSIEAPVFANGLQKMSDESERILIEDVATEEWQLTTEVAWEKYHTRQIVIHEIVPELLYSVSYNNETITVNLEDML